MYRHDSLACVKNIYPSGPQLFAKGKDWLTKWNGRYNIKKIRVCGESSDVSGETISSWKEQLSELLQGYKAEDMFNLDINRLFLEGLARK